MASNSKTEIQRYLFSSLVFFGLWIVLTGTFAPEELLFGLVASFTIAYFTYEKFTTLGFNNLAPRRVLYFLVYIPFFFKEVVKSNIDVAYRVLHPKMPIKPGIVLVKTKLKGDISKLILANSITLTPGTFTLDIIDDNYLIHWIYVESDNIEKASELIPEKFEKYIKEFAE